MQKSQKSRDGIWKQKESSEDSEKTQGTRLFGGELVLQEPPKEVISTTATGDSFQKYAKAHRYQYNSLAHKVVNSTEGSHGARNQANQFP